MLSSEGPRLSSWSTTSVGVDSREMSRNRYGEDSGRPAKIPNLHRFVFDKGYIARETSCPTRGPSPVAPLNTTTGTRRDKLLPPLFPNNDVRVSGALTISPRVSPVNPGSPMPLTVTVVVRWKRQTNTAVSASRFHYRFTAATQLSRREVRSYVQSLGVE